MIENETPKARAQRELLETLTVDLAKRLKFALEGTDLAFTLLICDVGDSGALAYASSCRREDMRRLLREILEKLEIQAAADAAQHTRGSS